MLAALNACMASGLVSGCVTLVPNALATGASQRLPYDRFSPMILHLTGVLVDAEGRPVRAGAEGTVLRDTPFIAQAVDAERVFDTAELQRVLSAERRGELPGNPLKLDVAFDNLVAQFTRGTVQLPAR